MVDCASDLFAQTKPDLWNPEGGTPFLGDITTSWFYGSDMVDTLTQMAPSCLE